MTVSRRLRFEILRRDDHMCRYCGATAPDVKLTVDHVTPTALGGKDEAANLVTACQACNAGKSSIAPDAEIVADVAADAMRWARARHEAVAIWRAKRSALSADLEAFVEDWDAWGVPGHDGDRIRVPRDPDWQTSIERWLDAGFIIEDLIELIPKAMTKTHVSLGDCWRYYCGVVWRTLDDIENATTAALPDAAKDGSPPDDSDQAYEDGFEDGRNYERTRLAAAFTGQPEAQALTETRCVECDDRTPMPGRATCFECWERGL